jgi:ribonuclease BN (tRNA processing enzyme)
MTIRTFIKGLSVLGGCLVLVSCTEAPPACHRSTGVALQVLGSGGPIADDGRASTGYVIWADGKSRVLIDAGGGTFLRFGEAGARFEDLDFVGLSHLHTDHSADFPALVKSGNFSPRERSLAIAGPGGAGPFPGLKPFLTAMLHKDGGAYAYLGSFLDGTDSTPMLVPREVEGDEPAVVFIGDDLRVEALRVPHGIVPAVAFRVETGGEVIVFATDQNGSNPAFPEFARDATVLVMHMVVPEDVEGVARRLHAPPSVIGEIAARIGPGKLVLSHFMARSLADLDGNVARVAASYKGDIVVADDLTCVKP